MVEKREKTGGRRERGVRGRWKEKEDEFQRRERPGRGGRGIGFPFADKKGREEAAILHPGQELWEQRVGGGKAAPA